MKKRNIIYLLILFFIFLSFIIFASFLSRVVIKEPSNLGEKILITIADTTEDFWLVVVWGGGVAKEKFLDFQKFYIEPFFDNVWSKIQCLFSESIENKKSQVSRELKKETGELKAEAFKAGAWLWEKAEEIIKKKYF